MWLSTSSTWVHTSGKCNEQYTDLRLHTELSPNIKHKSTTQELGVKLTTCKARDFKKTYMEIINEEESMNNDHLVSNNNLWVSRLKSAPRFSKLKPPWIFKLNCPCASRLKLSLCFQVETVPVFPGWNCPLVSSTCQALDKYTLSSPSLVLTICHQTSTSTAKHKTHRSAIWSMCKGLTLSALKLHDFHKSSKSNMFNTLEIVTNHNTTQCPSEGPYRILSCGEF